MAMTVKAAIAALNLAIQTERDGYTFYQEAATRTANVQAQALFRSLAEDEIAHEAYLRNRLAALEQAPSWDDVTAEALPPSKLPRRGAPIFTEAQLEAGMRDYTSELSALRTAYLLERDAVNFYARAAEQTARPTAQTIFQELAAMEKLHRDILEQEYNLLSEQFKREMGFEPF